MHAQSTQHLGMIILPNMHSGMFVVLDNTLLDVQPCNLSMAGPDE